MDRRRFYRGLRIAVSAVCEILCVLLIVLWVRSYWWAEVLWRTDDNNVCAILGTNAGTMYVNRVNLLASGSWRKSSGEINAFVHRAWDSYTRTFKFPVEWDYSVGDAVEGRTSFGWRWSAASVSVQVPYWILVLSTGIFAIAPWAKRSFSLRTLLIATTLISLVLGLVVWSSR